MLSQSATLRHHLVNSIVVFVFPVWQLKQFAADHADELGTASRAVTQSIERAEANVQWMSLHFQEIENWFQQNP